MEIFKKISGLFFSDRFLGSSLFFRNFAAKTGFMLSITSNCKVENWSFIITPTQRNASHYYKKNLKNFLNFLESFLWAVTPPLPLIFHALSIKPK